MEKFVVTPAFR